MTFYKNAFLATGGVFLLCACSAPTRTIVEDQSLSRTPQVVAAAPKVDTPQPARINQPKVTPKRHNTNTHTQTVTNAPKVTITPLAIAPIDNTITTAPVKATAKSSSAKPSLVQPSLVQPSAAQPSAAEAIQTQKASTNKPSIAQTTPNPTQPKITNQPSVINQTPSSQHLPSANQAVIQSLLTEANTAKDNGNAQLAIIKLQQAQRIAPNEPKVYARLAAITLAEKQPVRAEQLARKGLALVGGNVSYLHYFWRLIAVCKQKQGDTQGQQQALQQAQRYAPS